MGKRQSQIQCLCYIDLLLNIKVMSTWTVNTMDGVSKKVNFPDTIKVIYAKRMIADVCCVLYFAIELFVNGEEESLDDDRLLESAEKVPLFMLLKQEVSDRLVLEALFKSCGGADWIRKDGWMTDTALGEWAGVEVDEDGRVICLYLANNHLNGKIPRELGQLTELGDLDMSCNKLEGHIPTELGGLNKLVYLILSENELTGSIPTELKGLETLHLGRNQLTDEFLDELGQ